MFIGRDRNKGADGDSSVTPEPVPGPPVSPETDETKDSLLGKFGSALQDKMQANREGGESPDSLPQDRRQLEDQGKRRKDGVNGQRMVVPEGVVIEGSLTSNSETEISGRVDGDVTVSGRLELGPSGVITGKVKAGHCRVEGLVEGNMECANELELSAKGRIQADVVTGNHFVLGGNVEGNISCAGKLHLKETAEVNGSVRAKTLVVDEGALFNGDCLTRPSTEVAVKDKGKEAV